MSAPLLHRPHARHGTMKLEPLISPTPSTGTGGAEVRSRCAHRSSTRAGPCDAVIDVVRSRRLESGAWLLLLPTLGLPRALLRRRFRLRLSLLRHAALLAVSEWRCRISARGDREHCIRITTARQKNQCFRSMQHVRTRGDTRCCAYPSASPARKRPRGVTAANRDPNSSDLSKTSMEYGFSEMRIILRRHRGKLALQYRCDPGCAR